MCGELMPIVINLSIWLPLIILGFESPEERWKWLLGRQITISATVNKLKSRSSSALLVSLGFMLFINSVTSIETVPIFSKAVFFSMPEI